MRPTWRVSKGWTGTGFDDPLRFVPLSGHGDPSTAGPLCCVPADDRTPTLRRERRADQALREDTSGDGRQQRLVVLLGHRRPRLFTGRLPAPSGPGWVIGGCRHRRLGDRTPARRVGVPAPAGAGGQDGPRTDRGVADSERAAGLTRRRPVATPMSSLARSGVKGSSAGVRSAARESGFSKWQGAMR
jgi:hypothetical protein